MNREDYVPFSDTLDHLILMHRDVHFGGSFHLMIDYYKKDGLGIQEEFDIDRILFLKEQEELQGNEALEDLLSDSEKAAVEEALAMYRELKKVSLDEQGPSLARAIADLIFSEEEFPTKEIHSVVSFKEKALEPLHALIDSPSLYDPLFPGYGFAPLRAARALRLLGDLRSLPILFSALRFEQFWMDEEIIQVFSELQGESIPFLLKKLQGKPLSKENEYAAMLLSNFTNEAIAQEVLVFLLSKEPFSNEVFVSYLLLCLTGFSSKKPLEPLWPLLSPQQSKELHSLFLNT